MCGVRATSDSLCIRPAGTADRDIIRTITCDTADSGRPVESLFPDREFAADVLTRYYTDFEPESAWIALWENAPAGYIMGCLAPSRCDRLMRSRIVPVAVVRMMLRDLVCLRSATLKALSIAFRNRGALRARNNLLANHGVPHLHINLLEPFRGKGIGSALLDVFLRASVARGATAMRVSVRGDNAPAAGFFRRMGFIENGSYPIFLPRGKAWYETTGLVLERKLLAGANEQH